MSRHRLSLAAGFLVLLAPSRVLAWVLEIVDANGNVGTHVSIAVSATGKPHVSYYDEAQRDLKYATRTSSGWTTTVVDATGDVGQYSSIALAPDGTVHISYYDAGNGDLKHAWLGTAWSKEVVDPTGDVGKFSAIALDAVHQPSISYYDATQEKLKFAYRESTVWTRKHGPDVILTSGTALALLDANPLIAYYDGTQKRLNLAIFNRSGGVSPTGLDESGWGVELVRPSSTTIDSLSLSLASSSEPRISYAELTAGGGTVRFVAKQCAAAGCVTQTTVEHPTGQGSWSAAVDVKNVGVAPADTSLRISPAGEARIAFFDSAASELNLVYARGSSGGPFAVEPVDTEGNVGTHAALGIEASGLAHIAYRNDSTKVLKYAYEGIPEAPPLCIRSSRALTRFGKFWGIQFESSPSPDCRVTSAVVHMGSGHSMTKRDTGANLWACIPGTNGWPTVATADVAVTLSPVLAPGGGFTECINDTIAIPNFWDTGQSIDVTLACGTAPPSTHSAPFDLHQMVPDGAFSNAVSTATVGCEDDLCLDVPGTQASDLDADGVGDECDICPNDADPNQANADGDTEGDACEPQCRDGLDNDSDGKIDHPNDKECSGPDDPLEGCYRFPPGLFSGSTALAAVGPLRATTGVSPAPPQGERAVLDRFRYPIAEYFACFEPPKDLPTDPSIGDKIPGLGKICLEGPITTGVPQRCPPLDCFIDGPGCMEPEQRYTRMHIPDEAVAAAVLFVNRIITKPQFDRRLSELITSKRLTIDVNRGRRLYLPGQRVYLIGLGVAALVAGALFLGWRARNARRDGNAPSGTAK